MLVVVTHYNKTESIGVLDTDDMVVEIIKLNKAKELGLNIIGLDWNEGINTHFSIIDNPVYDTKTIYAVHDKKVVKIQNVKIYNNLRYERFSVASVCVGHCESFLVSPDNRFSKLFTLILSLCIGEQLVLSFKDEFINVVLNLDKLSFKVSNKFNSGIVLAYLLYAMFDTGKVHDVSIVANRDNILFPLEDVCSNTNIFEYRNNVYFCASDIMVVISKKKMMSCVNAIRSNSLYKSKQLMLKNSDVDIDILTGKINIVSCNSFDINSDREYVLNGRATISNLSISSSNIKLRASRKARIKVDNTLTIAVSNKALIKRFFCLIDFDDVDVVFASCNSLDFELIGELIRGSNFNGSSSVIKSITIKDLHSETEIISYLDRMVPVDVLKRVKNVKYLNNNDYIFLSFIQRIQGVDWDNSDFYPISRYKKFNSLQFMEYCNYKVHVECLPYNFRYKYVYDGVSIYDDCLKYLISSNEFVARKAEEYNTRIVIDNGALWFKYSDDDVISPVLLTNQEGYDVILGISSEVKLLNEILAKDKIEIVGICVNNSLSSEENLSIQAFCFTYNHQIVAFNKCTEGTKFKKVCDAIDKLGVKYLKEVKTLKYNDCALYGLMFERLRKYKCLYIEGFNFNVNTNICKRLEIADYCDFRGEDAYDLKMFFRKLSNCKLVLSQWQCDYLVNSGIRVSIDVKVKVRG